MRVPAFAIVIATLALVVGFGVCVGARGWVQSSQDILGVTATVSAGLFTIDAEVDGAVLTSGRYCPSADDNVNTLCDADADCRRSCTYDAIVQNLLKA